MELPEESECNESTEVDAREYDFVLLAYGGRKETSKTVHYRCLLNENGVPKLLMISTSSPIKIVILKMLTYHMSFQYRTVSKVYTLYGI